MSVTEQRQNRVREMLQRRLASVSVVVESVHRRHNVSAILRSAEAFGVHDIHMVTGGFRPSKGAARGSERWLQFHRHAEITTCVQTLKDDGFQLFVADFEEGAWTPDTVPVDSPIAVLMGAELTGVSDVAKELADGIVTIPMPGLTSSLNVSAAAAILLHRVTTRRRAVVGGGDLPKERQEHFFQNWLERESISRAGMLARVRR